MSADGSKSPEAKSDTHEDSTSETSRSSSVANNNNNNQHRTESKNDNINFDWLRDPFYEFDEPKPQRVESELYYTPSHFLRTHSKNNNPADVQTQVGFKIL